MSFSRLAQNLGDDEAAKGRTVDESVDEEISGHQVLVEGLKRIMR